MARQTSSSDRGADLIEIDRQIAIARDNLRDLTEQAAAYSGAGDEERAAQRIADQEARIADLMQQRAALAPSGKPKVGVKSAAPAKNPKGR